jgi:hypothetical protein
MFCSYIDDTLFFKLNYIYSSLAVFIKLTNFKY